MLPFGARVQLPTWDRADGEFAAVVRRLDVDTASKQLTWTGSTSGLTGDATAAHFHGPADPGGNASVAVPMASFKATFTGAATLTDAQMADLLAGKWYVNIHTAKNANGEIRGQVVKDK